MNKLKTLRKENNLTQEELAKKIGVNLRTLQKWENGESSIRIKNAEKLAKHFGVPVGYLLGYSEILEKFSEAYTEIENYIDNPLKYEKFGKGLADVNQSYMLIIQKLIESDKEFGTNFADVLINYISLNSSDKLIVFDLIQKMANKDT